MAIPSGQRLGPYEILSAIGAGGMGEVYRARDTRLDRIVAIKISNEQFSERFEREARAVASLNHSNICHLYDVGPNYLVMEHIEGSPLKGPLPLDQALKYAAQICDALDAAHKKGITHRDLKPANILVAKSGIKLLDFGLAKIAQTDTPPDDATLKMALTGKNEIVGTLYYMSPEQLQAQATGQEIDARSDVFSFGLVLYEMLTGKRAFDGASQASVIAAILERPAPSIAAIAPPALERLLQRCLAKDPDGRWQSARDLKAELNWIAELGSQGGVPAPLTTESNSRESLAWIVACGFAVLTAAFASWGYLHARSAGSSPVLAYIPPPPDTHYLAFGFGSGPAVVSPDGSKLAFTAIDQNGAIKIWTRSLKANDAEAEPGTDGASKPFWSPDSKSLGFFASGKLKTVDLSKGGVQVLSDNSVGEPAAWAPDGTILFTPARSSALFRISASGGKAVPFGALGANDYSESSPAVLPDGKQILVVVTDKMQNKRIELKSLTSSASQIILDDADFPAYSDGFLLFIRNGKIFAQPFDSGSGKLSGSAAPIADAEWYSIAGGSVLVFQTLSRESRLQWLDASGNPIGTIGRVGAYYSAKISPDGKQILASAHDPQGGLSSDLWSLPAAGGVIARMTFGAGRKSWCVWSPDGKYIAYGRVEADGKSSILRKPSDGSGAEETLLTLGPDIRSAPVVDWSADGRYISYDQFDVSKGLESNWVLPLAGEKKPFQPAPVSADQYDGDFSPDGHWLAYFSYESGQPEVYVVPFPGPGGKYQISHGGGWALRWDKRGDLFYLSTGNQLMKAELTLSAQSIQVKSLAPLFPINLLDVTAPLFDVSSDGQRILAIAPARPESSSIGLLLNWTELLRK